MKNYFVEYTNEECDFIEAKTDNSAYNKACKMAKELCTKVNYLAEIEVDEEEQEIVGEDRVIIKDGKEV